MTQTMAELKLSDIKLDERNVRDVVNGDDLVDSIKTFGVLQPLNVRAQRDGDTYIIIAGHRRYDAAVKAGLETVPCVITNGTSPTDDASVTAMMLVENLQRQDLTVVEQARGFKTLADAGWKQKEIADKTGISASVISRRIKIAGLPDEILALIDENTDEYGEVEVGKLTLEDAEALVPLAALDPAKAIELVTDADRYPSSYEITYAIKEIERERAARELTAALTKADLPLVNVDLVQPRFGSKPDLVFTDDDGSAYMWCVVTEDRQAVVNGKLSWEDDDETIPVMREQLVVIGTGPLDLEAAKAEDFYDGFTLWNDGGEPVVVPVHKTPVRTAEEQAAYEASLPDQEEAKKDAERERQLAERKERALQKAKADHDLAQFQAMVAGKVNKTDVIDWAIPFLFEEVHEETKKKACGYLQLDPVLTPKKAWVNGSYQEVEGKTEKNWRATFDKAVEEAQGMGLMRIVLAVILARGPGFSEAAQQRFAAIKTALGFEEFDPEKA